VLFAAATLAAAMSIVVALRPAPLAP
jgi:hypothetical protein